MSPTTTLWPLDAQTIGKHKVLREYLNAWLPIMSAWNKRILFIDGFAGPGEYEGGEDGSPIIAMKAFRDHRFRGAIQSEVVFLFIEEDHDRAEHLQSAVNHISNTMPSNMRVIVKEGTFDGKMTDLLDGLRINLRQLAPAFVMIDPFGLSDTPMSVIQRILSNKEAEVYVSFMYRDMNRFKIHPSVSPHLDLLFGTQTWQQGVEIEDIDARKDFFYGLYAKQLKSAGANYVIRFELYKGRELIYAIFFGTHDIRGCQKMKEAIWRVMPFGDFAFRGTRGGQLIMDLATADFRALREAIKQYLAGRGWVGIETIEEFVNSDETDYHDSHLRKGALIPMEDQGEIDVERPPKGRRGQYPTGTRIRLKQSPQLLL